MRGLLQANCAEGCFRKLVILQIFMAVGRTGEVGSLDWEQIKMDYANGLPFLNWRDLKCSKDKDVPILPSCSNSDLDLFVAYGDAAIMGQFNLEGPSPSGEPKALFPQFALVDKLAPKVSRWLVDMMPGSKSQFAKFAVVELDPETTSHGLRHGSIDEMEAHGVAGELAADLSGHAPNPGGGGGGSSGAFESSYHKATHAKTIMGNILFPILPTINFLPYHL